MENPLVHIRDAHVLMGENVPAWITTFDQFHANIIASGGDDSCLRIWDLRMQHEAGTTADSASFGEKGGTMAECSAKNSKTHRSGVTSLQYHPSREHILVSGSYDGLVRVWDCRKLKHPLTTLTREAGCGAKMAS